MLHAGLPPDKLAYNLWAHNLRLAILVAKEKFEHRHFSVVATLSEYVAAAVHGLWYAGGQFDPVKAEGARFSAFARWHIKKAIQRTARANRSGFRLPDGFLDTLIAATADSPRSNRFTEAELQAARTLFCEVVSIDNTASAHGVSTLLDSTPSIDDVRRNASDTEALRTVDQLIADVGAFYPRAPDMLRRFYGIGCEQMSGEQIGASLGITRQAVDISLKRYLRRLRVIAKAKKLNLSDLL